ncbi:nucleoside triphosphate pyrophosphohydrolase [Mycolicibacterium sp. CH28]|uniref:nucleoside triphosphate pyrophosphohydrolase n=1 Tax=Mycolicibacterium sp. CH28 TaxID=2512237 RepID=UPI00108010BB|nr:nucleoside triphosphate pyrophosphohydrolase [Mycolicibacterium sp. CH28]TGD87304.1 nucleoside triphosphate pyrophosphohydrolase [Mycolicibacterium sp. CH28]
MTVILVDPRRPSLVPVEAVELLGGDVQYTEEMPVKVPWSLPSARPLLTGAHGQAAPVLLSSDREHPAVRARLAAGARLIAVSEPQAGERLVDAVAIMDKLRTAGPWESEQTHDSLRRYLLEETYELFDAVRGGNLNELRDELGDVLLQVLFHARIAEEAPANAFSIDDVADALVRKLGNRVPAVLAGESISLEDQLAQWEERKALEKNSVRASCVDDIPTGQPALALAQKVIARVQNANLPADLIPPSILSVTVSAERDAENELRTDVLEFMDTVRGVERAITANRRDSAAPSELDGAAPLSVATAEEWRRHWPMRTEEPLELLLVPEVISVDGELLEDVETVLAAEEFDLPELAAADDVELAEPDVLADQPNSVDPQ